MNIYGVNNALSGRIIVTDDGSYKKPSKFRTATGIIAGSTLGSLAAVPIQLASRKPVLVEMQNFEKLVLPKVAAGVKIESDVAKEFVDAAKQAFKVSKLENYGVKFTDVKTLDDIKNLDKAIPKWIKKVPFLNKLVQNKIDLAKSMIVDGRNACFVPNKGVNEIFVNKQKMSYAAFHEMGHAMNKHMSTTGKILQKLRGPGMALAAVATLVGIFKRKKAKGEQPKGVVDKTTTFIKNNAATLTLAGTLPTVVEEGLASKNAYKLAKGILSEKNLSLMKQFNKKAWLTYVGMAAASTATVWVASKVRDAIAGPKKIEQ